MASERALWRELTRSTQFLIEAAGIMEMAVLKDELAVDNYSLDKNLGLAYMHMVRSKGETIEKGLRNLESMTFAGENFLDALDFLHDEEWKGFATNRWAATWKKFLAHEDARKDASYEAIQKIYSAVYEKAK